MMKIMVSETLSITSELYYESHGIGDDVLMIHGWASSGRMWDPLVEQMSATARCWALDLAGFGQSPLPERSRPDLDTHLDWIVQFLEQHHIRPRMVIGHSMGGLLTLKLAHQRPDLAENLILLCPVVTGRFAFNANLVVNSQWWTMVSAKTEKFWTMIQSSSIAPVFSAPFYVAPALRGRYVQEFQQARWDAAVAALESIAQESMLPYLTEIQQPALVIIGGRDYTVPPDEGRLAAGHLPNARLVEFKSAHHQPLDEVKELVIQQIDEFAREVGLF